MLNRRDILQLANASLDAKRADYARKLARVWLQAWPADFSVNLLLGQALYAEAENGDALAILKKLAVVDPERAEVHQLTADIADRIGDPALRSEADGLSRVLRGDSLPRIPWMVAARESHSAIESLQWEQGRRAAEHAVQANPDSLLPALLLLKSHWLAGQAELAFPLAQGFYDRWPQCVAVTLCLAEALLHAGDYTRGVELLHDVVTLDPAGEVAGRYWGGDHVYRPIWPPQPRVQQPAPIPPEVATLLGLNRLDAAEIAPESLQAGPQTASSAATTVPSTEFVANGARSLIPEAADHSDENDAHQSDGEPVPPVNGAQRPAPQPAAYAASESLRDVQAELEKVQQQLDAVSPGRRTNGARAPVRGVGVHVIITCARALVEKYGARSAERVLTLTRLLAESTAKNTGLQCSVVLPDVADSLTPFRLPPVDGGDPAALKELINALSAHYQRDGKRIGSMLLIGGDDIVPFYRLPNPTDDHDADVPSDNPYGTGDENYFVPEWPVGRIPGPCGDDANALTHLIQSTTRAHAQTAPRLPALVRWLRWLFPAWQPGASEQRNFGYSADIWRDASLEVFHVIGKTRDLVTSPPLQAENMSTEMLARAADFLYCNLHGLEDAADWYGESASLNGEMPNYPIALRPTDLGHGNAPAIVFTEACYGANIMEKRTPDAAMCLRFLQTGSRAVVGSTRIAYGAVGTPLIGADLLGRYFWHHLLRGIPVGEALRRARMGLAQTMDSRQGFLDGEDQKALVSFVLYGDPLLRGPKLLPAAAKKTTKTTPVAVAELKATCSKSEKACAQALGHPDALVQVKALVSQYLPGMENADVSVRRPHLQCDGGDHICFASHSSAPKTLDLDPDQLVYSLSQTVQVNHREKQRYARATVNRGGKVVKLAVSR